MRDYFCGWYWKCQSQTQTLAVIPAFHRTNGEESCSIQLITPDLSQSVRFPVASFCRNASDVTIAGNRFTSCGFSLDLHGEGVSAVGSVKFGNFTPLRYDIMGPFRYVPFMECRHSVFSMRHTVTGTVSVNGTDYVFCDDVGYAEGDRGRSFPKEYIWTQCSFDEGALMLSVADIPLCGCRFTGVIGAVLWKGREYRLATYLGAQVCCIRNGEIVIRQGNRSLTARLLDKHAMPLCAPNSGAMTRTIHEHIACRAFYRFEENGRTVFSFEAPNAAFEYEYPY